MFNDVVKLAVKNDSVHKEMLNLGYSLNQANIVSSKINDIKDIPNIIDSGLNHIPELSNLTDIDIASDILHKHVQANSHIALVTDSDMDGISSAIVLFDTLCKTLKVKKENLTIIINNRKNGNGITEKLLVTIMDEHVRNPIDLILTADHGSSDGLRIEKMKKEGMEVIVTDHHLVPKVDNAYNADAFVNPQKEQDNVFKFISGCAVAYFLIVNTRVKYIDNYPDEEDALHEILPIVAASTIGDSMKLHDPINRALVNAGLKEMNSLRSPLWQAFKYVTDITGLITEEILSFNFIPAINASNRMGNPMLAFEFYRSENYKEAIINFERLLGVNNERKKLQNTLIRDANLQIVDPDEKKSLTLFLKRGFGLNGIVSSNIGERYFKPTMTFVEQNGVLSGSGRSINSNFNLNKALGNIKDKHDGLILGYGGHKEACGCSIPLDRLDEFKIAFNDEAIEQLDNTDTDKIFEVIGEIDHEHLNESIIEDIRTIAPYGIGFNKILYVGTFVIRKIFYVGKSKESISLQLELDTGEKLDCFIYNAISMFDHDILARDKRVKVVYAPKLDTYRGALEFKLEIRYIEEV